MGKVQAQGECLHRSADFQSAVSQYFQPADAEKPSWQRTCSRSADWKSAVPQVGNLPYSWNLLYGCSVVLGSWLLVLLQGCAVGPNYKRPSIDSPASFRGDSSPANKSFADLAWWNVYQDTALQVFVREAFTNNYDVRIALARVEQARALAMQARSQFVPTVSYNGSISRGRNEAFGSALPNNAT